MSISRVKVETSVSGLYPRSEEVVKTSRDFERSRTDEKSLQRSLQNDATAFVSLQILNGLTKISDGQLKWQDPLRAVAESLAGVRIEAGLSRWFDTNTFYKKPVIVGELEVSKPETFLFDDYSAWPGLPTGIVGFDSKNSKRSISILGPYTQASLVDDQFYGSGKDLVKKFSKITAKVIGGLAKQGITHIQINEPSLVYAYNSTLTKENLETTVNSYSKYLSNLPVEISLHTPFGDSSEILPVLLKIPNIRTIGIDFTQTSLDSVKDVSFRGRSLGIGYTDARNSLIESPDWIVDFSLRAIKTLDPDCVVIIPSNDMRYLPRTHADKKVVVLGNAAKLLRKTIGEK